jgi:tetratricopeptide (TPR) repeat protein
MPKKRPHNRKQPLASSQNGAASIGFGQQAWLFALILVAVTAIAYSPAWSGKFLWDDNDHITEPRLRSLEGLREIWTKPGATQQYYPLLHSAFWLEHKLWGDAVLPYHLVSILLHGISALLVWRILLKLEVPGAWLAAGLFALHPVQVESVAWITELKNTLSGILFFAAALSYLKFDQARNWRRYALSLGLFLLALMCKTVIAVLPAALLVVFWWKRGRLSWKRDAWPLVPFFALGMAAGLVSALIERQLVGAHGEAFAFSLIERCLIAGRAFWFYLFTLLWPANLSFIYPQWKIDQSAWWQYLFPIVALLLLAVLWKLRHKSRAPLAAILLFVGILFPVLGFLNIYYFQYSFVADHWLYLACLPILALAAAGISLSLSRAQIGNRLPGHLICGALLLGLAALTWRQSHIYTDPETVWRTTLERNPESFMVHNNFSAHLLEKGQIDEAITHSSKAVMLRPKYAPSNVSLGNALRSRGRVDEAIDSYQKALNIDPRHAPARANLGSALYQKGRFREAIEEFEKALYLDPTAAEPHSNLALALLTAPEAELRNPARAVELARRADHLSGGGNPVILHNLALACAQNNQLDEAIEIAEKALRLATGQGNPKLAQMLRKEIELYRTHRR